VTWQQGKYAATGEEETREIRMSGHSKWATTKHKKAAIDAKRAKAFAKFIKAIEVAARMGGADISGNPALDLAVSKAKKNSVPNDNIDRGNRPGIYPEFKESWLNPKDIEIRVYNILNDWGWNIITQPAAANTPFYVHGKVNVGNTNGKVILQTFSFDAFFISCI